MREFFLLENYLTYWWIHLEDVVNIFYILYNLVFFIKYNNDIMLSNMRYHILCDVI